ncbi:MAG: hypothetical protein HOD87_01315, partial [Gammaproteobacteria bacterium]|nr:hypothetical protein [Gammaproteobacteria bacterium]
SPSSFLEAAGEQTNDQTEYSPTVLQELDSALGEAVNNVVVGDTAKPLGAWLVDELVLAVRARYPGDLRSAALFMHTKPRNFDRWMAKIDMRERDRLSSAVWREPRRLLKSWVREASIPSESPQESMQEILMAHLENHSATISVRTRAKIIGVSIPTYQKRNEKYKKKV